MKYKVKVLLSAYNGERYIKEQIDSILKQKEVEVSLIVRDDGSKDSTPQILSQYEKANKITYIKGSNIGYIRSFFQLLRDVKSEEDSYYSLADQDDVWDEDKLYNAVRSIREKELTVGRDVCVLYSCGRRLLLEDRVVDDSVPFVDYGFTGFKNGHSLQGCAMVFNNELKKRIDKYHFSEIPCYHDLLIMQICKVNSGKIVFDRSPHFSYRVHNENTLGFNNKGVFGEIKRLFSKDYIPKMDVICRQFIEVYGEEMSEENHAICKKISMYKKGLSFKLNVIRDKNIVKGSLIRRMQVMIEVMLNRA